ncbi:MAG: DNA-directed RNA polymerase subunit omega [Chthonomonas sp.]|nr:DNA-directed RNA polymerase subunit omega [Chthonomonas sp.]
MTSQQGPDLPLADILNDYEYGQFVLSNLAARRAKQLKDGAPPLVRCESNHPITIALAEIAQGKIRPILGVEEIDSAAVEADLNAAISDETVPAEFGILLPSLDEIGHDELMDEVDHEDDHDPSEEPAASLTDLLEDDVTVESESSEEGESLSLDDLAEKENDEEDPDAHD